MNEIPFTGSDERRESTIPKRLAELIAEKEPESVATFRVFLKFLRENVTVEELLADRLAQANLHEILQVRHSDKELGNPYPRIHVEGWGYQYDNFMLKGDNLHLYFFDLGWPRGITPYLRPEDVIPPEDYSHEKYPKHRFDVWKPFNKTLRRAPLTEGGGLIEFYNYNTGQWEVSSDESCEELSRKDAAILRNALQILAQDEEKLAKFGHRVLAERERKERLAKKGEEQEEKRNTFSLNLGGKEVIFRVFEQKEDSSLLGRFLEALSKSSKLLKIRPDSKTHLKSFGVKSKMEIDYAASPFDQRWGNLIEEKGEKRDKISAFFLGAFSHPKITNLTYRLIAIPANQLPKDTAFAIGAKWDNDTNFSGLFDQEMCFVTLRVTEERARPEGFKDGKYLIFSAEDLLNLDSTTGRMITENQPQTIRIIGVSKEEGSLFYKDVDASQVPIKWLKAAEESPKGRNQIRGPRSKNLPPASKLLPKG